jgi:hypothetical protein
MLRRRKNEEKAERKGILGSGGRGRGGRPRQHERASPAPSLEGRVQLVRIVGHSPERPQEQGTGSWR